MSAIVSAAPEVARGKSANPTFASVREQSIYTTVFWLSYVANVALVAANAVTFRFAELVVAFGGKEQTAGAIVGVATAVALGSRLFLGQAIDRYGVRKLWMLSAVLFAVGALSIAWADSLSWTLYVARSCFALGLAGGLTCSAVHIQNLVPDHRRTEIIGSLGSSGFVGLMLGICLGDLCYAGFEGRTRFQMLFGVSAGLGGIYLGLITYLTRNEPTVEPTVSPAAHRLIVKYWPGNVMVVAFAMGMFQAVTTIFLTRFATAQGLSGLGPFFVGYACTAFTFRIISRSWSHTVGRHRMILLGLTGQVISLAGLPFVSTEWQFVLPAMAGGFGHALLFPAVVSLGAEAFPMQSRGTANTLVFGFFDIGIFASAPVLGAIIDAFDGHGFVPMFATSALFAAAVAVLYARTSSRTLDTDLNGQSVPLGKLMKIAVGRGTGALQTFGSRLVARIFGVKLNRLQIIRSRVHSESESSRSQCFACERKGDVSLGSEEVAIDSFARQGVEAEPLATEQLASEVLVCEEVVRPNDSASSAPRFGRGVAGPATRCR